MIGLPHSWVSVDAQNKLLILNQRGYVVDGNGILMIRGVPIRVEVELPGHSLVFRRPNGEVITWRLLVQHLTPQPAPRQRRHPNQVLAEHLPTPTTLLGQRLSAAMSR